MVKHRKRRKRKRRGGYQYIPRRRSKRRSHRRSMLHDGKRIKKGTDVIYVKGKGLYERIRQSRQSKQHPKSYPVYRSAHYEEKERKLPPPHPPPPRPKEVKAKHLPGYIPPSKPRKKPKDVSESDWKKWQETGLY